MRFLLRFLGLIFFAGAFAAAVVDGARSLAASQILLTPAGVALFWAFPRAAARFQTFVETRVHPLLWDPVLVHVLLAPAFLDLALIGGLCFLVTRSPAPQIGYSSRDP
jgi:hypothetical protein